METIKTYRVITEPETVPLAPVMQITDILESSGLTPDQMKLAVRTALMFAGVRD